jgi:hypothetical protein
MKVDPLLFAVIFGTGVFVLALALMVVIELMVI